MTQKLTLDKAGRIVLPKPVREELGLAAGDTLQLDTEGDHILLTPVREQAAMRKEQGIWVFDEGTPAADSIAELIDSDREKRNRELSE